MSTKSFFTYQAATPTPSLEEALAAGAIAATTTEAQWSALTPGMRREIVRSAKRRAPAPITFDELGAARDALFAELDAADAADAVATSLAKGGR